MNLCVWMCVLYGFVHVRVCVCVKKVIQIYYSMGHHAALLLGISGEHVTVLINSFLVSALGNSDICILA